MNEPKHDKIYSHDFILLLEELGNSFSDLDLPMSDPSLQGVESVVSSCARYLLQIDNRAFVSSAELDFTQVCLQGLNRVLQLLKNKSSLDEQDFKSFNGFLGCLMVAVKEMRDASEFISFLEEFIVVLDGIGEPRLRCLGYRAVLNALRCIYSFQDTKEIMKRTKTKYLECLSRCLMDLGNFQYGDAVEWALLSCADHIDVNMLRYICGSIIHCNYRSESVSSDERAMFCLSLVQEKRALLEAVESIVSCLSDHYNLCHLPKPSKPISLSDTYLHELIQLCLRFRFIHPKFASEITSLSYLLTAIKLSNFEHPHLMSVMQQFVSQVYQNVIIDALADCDELLRLNGVCPSISNENEWQVVVLGSLSRNEWIAPQPLQLGVFVSEEWENDEPSTEYLRKLFSLLAVETSLIAYPQSIQLSTGKDIHFPLFHSYLNASGFCVHFDAFPIDENGKLNGFYMKQSLSETNSFFILSDKILTSNLYSELLIGGDHKRFLQIHLKSQEEIIRNVYSNANPLLLLNAILDCISTLYVLTNHDPPQFWIESLSAMNVSYLFSFHLKQLIHFISISILSKTPIDLLQFKHHIIGPLSASIQSFLKSQSSFRLSEQLPWTMALLNLKRDLWTSHLAQSFKGDDHPSDMHLLGSRSGELSLSHKQRSGLLHLIYGKRPLTASPTMLYRQDSYDTSKPLLSHFGRHRVLFMENFVFKLFPESPGAYEAVVLMDEILFGHLNHSLIPKGELFRLESHSEAIEGTLLNRSFPVYVTQMAEGECMARMVDPSPSVHSTDFSRCFILSLIFDFEAVKPEQIFIHKQRLQFVGCDRLLLGSSSDSVYPKNFLLLLSQMNQTIDSEIASMLSSLDVFEAIEGWLLSLSVANAENTSPALFQQKELEYLLELFCSQKDVSAKDSGTWENAFFGSCIPLLLGQKSVLHVLDVMLKLRKLLQSNPKRTHTEILQNINPKLAFIYYKQSQFSLSPFHTYARLSVGHFHVDGSSKLSAAVSLRSALDTLRESSSLPISLQQIAIPPKKWEMLSPSALLDVLAKSRAVQMTEAYSIVLEGRPLDLRALMIPFNQETIVEQLDLSNVSTFAMQRLVSDFTVPLGIKRLDLSNSIDLDAKMLKQILSCCPLLVSLNISNCHQLDVSSLFSSLSSNCPYLFEIDMDNLSQLVQLNNSTWNRFSSNAYLQSLCRLVARNASFLTSVEWTSDVLQVLDLSDCPNANISSIKTPNLEKLYLDGNALLLSASGLPHLPSLQLLSLKRAPRLVHLIMDGLKSPVPSLKSLFIDDCPSFSSLHVFGLSQLNLLSVKNCRNLRKLGPAPTLLQSAFFDGCIRIPKKYIMFFIQGGCSLDRIHIQDCSSIPSPLQNSIQSAPSSAFLSFHFGLTDEPSRPFFAPKNLFQLKRFIRYMISPFSFIEMQIFPRAIDLSKLCQSKILIPDAVIIRLVHLFHDTLEEIDLQDLSSLSACSLLSLQRVSSQLRYLNLSGSFSSLHNDAALFELFSHPLPELSSLSIASIPMVSERCLKALASNAIRLESLDISNSSASDTSIALVIRNCPLLRRLDASNCPFISDGVISALITHATKLQTLKVANCLGISDSALKSLFKSPLVRLFRVLDLSAIPFRNNSLEELARNAKRLCKLVLEDVWEVDDTIIQHLAHRCKTLEHIDIRGCFRVSDRSIEVLCKNCSQLKEVMISNCEGISDRSIEAMARACSWLKNLYIRKCSRITNSAILTLASSCESLRYLSVVHCSSVTKAGLERVSWIRPDVIVFTWSV